MTPVQASKKLNENLVYNNLKDNREIQKPEFQQGQLVPTTDIKLVFSKRDSTNWSYNLYTVNKINHDKIPSYRISYLPERFNENLLRSTNLTLDENYQVMKKLNLLH